MDLTGKIALVTGGTRIGSVVAKTLAARGADIALTYHTSRDAAQQTARDVHALGRRAFIVKANLARPADADRAVTAVHRALGGIDILVHLASIYEKTPMATLQKRPPSLAAGSGAVDLDAAWRLALRCAPLMRARGGGRVVLFSDWTAGSARPRYTGFSPYYIAKSGVKALTETLALELAPEVLVNTVAPGPILPAVKSGLEDRRAVVRATPLGRWGGAEEIAKAVLFFIESNFVTGECLRVDGGRHLL